MKYIDTVITYVTKLSSQSLQKQLCIVLAGITLSLTGIIYYTHSRSTQTMQHLQSILIIAQKSAAIMAENAKIQKEEERIQDLLEENKEFNIKSFFQKFYRDNDLQPESGWDTITNPIEGNSTFEEVILSASFRHETTEKLVTILDDLDKKEIVYLKELIIKNEEEKTIRFDITLATKKMRRATELQ